MKWKDLKQVLEIERLCFKEPYSRQIFEQELKIEAAVLWVVPYRNRILGYIDYWVISDQMELVSIAVHPKFNGRGLGKLLMSHMIRDGKTKGIRSIILDVRKSNRKARSLYRKFGFKRVGLRKRYYSDSQEDAIIMKKVVS